MTVRIKRGWHFLSANKRLSYGDNRLVRRNTWMRMKPSLSTGKSSLSIRTYSQPTLCHAGMHAAPTILGAIRSLSSDIDILCRVVVRGQLDISTRKFCGNERRVIKMGIVLPALMKFAEKSALEYIGRNEYLTDWQRQEFNNEIITRFLDISTQIRPLSKWHPLCLRNVLITLEPTMVVGNSIKLLTNIGVSDKNIERRLQRAVKGLLT